VTGDLNVDIRDAVDPLSPEGDWDAEIDDLYGLRL
jgi:hypothetical protein